MPGAIDLLHVLLVDDRRADRVALQAILEQVPQYRVTVCSTGEEALKALLRENYCLILLDLNLPDLDGFELARLLKQHDRTRLVPIVFITGSSLVDQIQKAYSLGGVDYLVKPVKADILLAKASVYVELHRQRLALERQATEVDQSRRLAYEQELAEARVDAERKFRTIAEQEAHRAETLYEEAVRAMRVRDSFLLVAAHELRTPLATALLGLQLLERTVEAPGSTQVKVVIRQVRRLTRLAEDLVDAVRLGEGKLQLKRESVDVAAALRDVVQQFEDIAASSNCAVAVEAPKVLLAEVDAIRFEQLVENLLSNAIKYGRGSPVRVRLTPGADRLRLEVEDEGIGIPLEDRERIFERFERAVSERAYGGLGLGLFIVKQIAWAHAGSVRVEDAPGRGSRFVAELPLHPVASVAQGALGAAARPPSSPNGSVK
jgi:signal transduction histidine kinase